MNEIDLNDLAIKTDSLPDSWKMLLIDPTTGLPAKNMTVARFIELFSNKLPEATHLSKGLLGGKVLKKLDGLTTYLTDIDANTLISNIALVSGTNLPTGSKGFWYIIQLFYQGISVSANRLQIAISYSSGSLYTRTSFNGVFTEWNKFQYSRESTTYSIKANALTNTIVEEVPVSADTPMTLQEDGQAAPTMQTVERYEYSIPKMAEMILSLRKEIDELKEGAGKLDSNR